jgi:hypothetical protein
MRRYIIASGALFALLALIHIARLAMEGTGPLGNPFFILITIVATALATWAVLLLRRPSGPNRVVRAYPMLPRHEAEIRRLAHDLTVPRAKDKDDFYMRMGVGRETWHLQETSLGHWVIVVTDMADKRVDDAARIYAASPKDFDRWFKEQVMLITGLDPTITPLGPPTEELFDSSKKEPSQ